MIATLTGQVSEKLTDQVIIDVNGVGYGVFISAEDHGKLATGEAAKLYVYEHVREQAHDLFGFTTRAAQKFFEQLLSVNGVGPKMALNVLSVGTTEMIKSAIAQGEVKTIQQANGVGKKVAERIVVDLKDKVGLISADLESTGILQSEALASGDEAVAGLMALGYTAADALTALKNVDPSLSSEDRIKQALKAGA